MTVQTLFIKFPDGGTSGFLAMPCKEVASRLSFASQALTEARGLNGKRWANNFVM